MSRRRRKKNGRPYLWVPLALAACAVGLWLALSARYAPARRASLLHLPVRRAPLPRAASYSQPRPSAAPAADPVKISEAFQRVLSHTDGEQAWIRKASMDAGAAYGPRDAFEALVTPQAFEPSLAAIRREAAQQSLSPRFASAVQKNGLQVSHVALYDGHLQVGRFELREVRQLTRIAIVIDDLGQNTEAVRALLAIRSQLTFSVIPRLPYSRQAAEAAHRAGTEVILHLPMQPVEDWKADVSSDEIREGMSSAQVFTIIRRDLATVPYAAGVNNHMGSRATSDTVLMNEVMGALGREHLYFIDSRTTPDSVALAAARRMGIPAFYRSVFLDDVRTVPYTLAQLRKLCAIAERQGAALAIGHPYPTTVAALRRFLPELRWRDIELVSASRLTRAPGIARLSPPRHTM